VSLPLWLGFLLAAILIAVTPGPGAVISMSTGSATATGRH
jgi:homoserine/homoserine lactone efflux protein